MRNESDITTDATEIIIISDSYAQLYANKSDNLIEVDYFLETKYRMI